MNAEHGKNYRDILWSTFKKRQARNPLYSMRAFSRDLGVGKTTLCEVIKGRRHFSIQNAKQVADKLALPPVVRKSMEEEISNREGELERYQLLAESQFEEISDWYFFALLSLARVNGARNDIQWISRRLGISKSQAAVAREKLIELGFLKVKGRKLLRTNRFLHTSNDVSSASQRKFHHQNLILADLSLQRDSPEERDFNAITMAINPSQLLLAKKKILKFKREMATLLSRGSKSKVYTLSIQLFPAKGE